MSRFRQADLGTYLVPRLCLVILSLLSMRAASGLVLYRTVRIRRTDQKPHRPGLTRQKLRTTMKTQASITRRGFIRTTAAGSLALGWLGAGPARSSFASELSKPAILGGTPAHTGGWTKWPQWREEWEPQLLKVWRSGHWYRGSDEQVEEFERG